MTADNVIGSIPQAKNDADAAMEYRDQIAALLNQVAEIMNRARRDRNFQVGFGMSEDQGGRIFIGNLQIMKRF